MDLDDVLNEYVSAFPQYPPTHSQMMGWIREYPQYSKDIAEFTVSWCQMATSASVAESIDPAMHERLLESGMAVVKKILSEKKADFKEEDYHATQDNQPQQ